MGVANLQKQTRMVQKAEGIAKTISEWQIAAAALTNKGASR
jgi:hypothetical protein